MVSTRLTRWAVAAALIAGSTFGITAQQPPSAFPVIVVLQSDAPFANYRASYRADGRAAAYHNRDVVAAIQSLEAQHGFRADRFYSAAIRGFSARLSAQQMGRLANDAIVSSIEPDGDMVIVGQSAQAKGKPGGGGSPVQVTPWGITRIGAAGKPSISTVRAYVIDTGIDLAHPDLNVVQNVNFAGGRDTDCNGHGTHVAGTIAAIDNTINVVGVASGAPLVAVKVLNCSGSGTTSGVIAGVDWVTANAVQPAIANMSLGGGASAALDAAVVNSAATGIVYALAAGNDGANACNSSPARAGTTDGVITTAATNSTDAEPSWSNYGACVDIWAPGAGILSTKKGGGTTTLSGTSMASPHVGGTAARYLALWAATSAADVEVAMKADALPTLQASKDGRSIVIVNAGAY